MSIRRGEGRACPTEVTCCSMDTPNQGHLLPRGTCPVLATGTGHIANMSIRRGEGRACPTEVTCCSMGHLTRVTCYPRGHAQSWPRALDILPTCPSAAVKKGHAHGGDLLLHGTRPTRVICYPRGTCPVPAAGTGHIANMSIRRGEGRACPTEVTCCSMGHLTRVTCYPRGHAQSWPRALDILPTCPSAAVKKGHAQPGSPATPGDMPSPGRGHWTYCQHVHPPR
ncbi:hypothetical protein QFZ79_003542 [Arthrobacter sp. V4I6]|nr:hypothetical protein [Arthrobacter sp. V1I7]MDQ0855431.1 hypothetical protein [Arthrobacter sp. V4I6]